jgi:hypothetical protein
LPESVEAYSRLGRFKRTGHQETYPCDFRRLLRAGGERRGEAAGQRADERPPRGL